MPPTYKKVQKPWNESTIAVAIEEVNKGAKIKPTAKKYGMSVGLLWNRLQEHKREEAHSDNRVC